MPARKEQHPCFPIFCGPTVMLFLLFSLVSARGAFSAGSPFEIEIGDLERGEAASKEVKKPQSPPSAKTRRPRKVSVPNVKAESLLERDYVRYTIRSGDNIYTILTTRFGLTSKKAERLIPEIKRINGIVDTSGLQIGQTLLLPLARKKVVVPQETISVTPHAPLPAPAAEAESLQPWTKGCCGGPKNSGSGFSPRGNQPNRLPELQRLIRHATRFC
jgi:LysM repeat protein